MSDRDRDVLARRMRIVLLRAEGVSLADIARIERVSRTGMAMAFHDALRSSGGQAPRKVYRALDALRS